VVGFVCECGREGEGRLLVGGAVLSFVRRLVVAACASRSLGWLERFVKVELFVFVRGSDR